MRHSNHVFNYEPWIIVIFLAGLAVFIVLLICFIHRRIVASDGLTGKERNELPSEQRELLSMLRQSGGPMRQTDLVDVMPYGLDYIAGILKEMESKGLIHREWKSEQGTFEITAAS